MCCAGVRIVAVFILEPRKAHKVINLTPNLSLLVSEIAISSICESDEIKSASTHTFVMPWSRECGRILPEQLWQFDFHYSSCTLDHAALSVIHTYHINYDISSTYSIR